MVSVAKRSPSVASLDSLSPKDQSRVIDRKTDMYQLAVKDLKLSQLRLLHVFIFEDIIKQLFKF